jgi:flagellar biosynthesis/type III secretory pathway protein FliH
MRANPGPSGFGRIGQSFAEPFDAAGIGTVAEGGRMKSLIIKSTEATNAVRQLGEPARPAEPPKADPEVSRLAAKIAALEDQLKQSRLDEDRLKREAVSAYEKGEEAGHAAGLEAAESRADERRDMLEAGIDKALAGYKTDFADVERLAVLVAHECLDRIFGNHLDRAEQLCAIVRHQLDLLDARNVVRISISTADFEELGPLTTEAIGKAGPAVILYPDEFLEAGEVRIDLLMGSISAGIGQQWGRLGAVLDDLAQAAE